MAVSAQIEGETTDKRRHCHHRRRHLTSDPELRSPLGRGHGGVPDRVHATQLRPRQQRMEGRSDAVPALPCSIWRQAAENVSESLTRGMRVVAQGWRSGV
jgi:single-strand DNA-binding protein